ncbi:MAG: glycosyltransferase [Acidobacteriota bacterium]|nr:glycosyltransferase [Acidobacteriota bacterium]
MTDHTPRVSIGIPVYNGEKYLAEAIDSALSQTYSDFEVVIADNASTDATPEICKSFSDKDDRVRYVRNPENLGASPNYRRVFELARGEYFCWMPADEAMLPGYLEKLVAVLDREPDVVLAFPRYRIRNNSEATRPQKDSSNADLRQPTARQRVNKMFRERIVGPNWPIFGLYRKTVLAQTQLLRPLIGADDYVTLQMALKGQLGQVPEELYVLRTHADAWHQARYKQSKGLARLFGTETVWAAAWFDPANKRMKVVFPHWRRLREFILLFWRSDESPRDKVSMTLVLTSYIAHHWKRLGVEVVAGFIQIATLPFASRRTRRLDAKPTQ